VGYKASKLYFFDRAVTEVFLREKEKRTERDKRSRKKLSSLPFDFKILTLEEEWLENDILGYEISQ
jgi:hypothetical protein